MNSIIFLRDRHSTIMICFLKLSLFENTLENIPIKNTAWLNNSGSLKHQTTAQIKIAKICTRLIASK